MWRLHTIGWQASLTEWQIFDVGHVCFGNKMDLFAVPDELKQWNIAADKINLEYRISNYCQSTNSTVTSVKSHSCSQIFNSKDQIIMKYSRIILLACPPRLSACLYSLPSQIPEFHPQLDKSQRSCCSKGPLLLVFSTRLKQEQMARTCKTVSRWRSKIKIKSFWFRNKYSALYFSKKSYKSDCCCRRLHLQLLLSKLPL